MRGYGASYRPISGAPVDPRLTAAFRKQTAAFDWGLQLGDLPLAPARIRLDGAAMPAYLLPAAGREREVRLVAAGSPVALPAKATTTDDRLGSDWA